MHLYLCSLSVGAWERCLQTHLVFQKCFCTKLFTCVTVLELTLTILTSFLHVNLKFCSELSHSQQTLSKRPFNWSCLVAWKTSWQISLKEAPYNLAELQWLVSWGIKQQFTFSVERQMTSCKRITSHLVWKQCNVLSPLCLHWSPYVHMFSLAGTIQVTGRVADGRPKTYSQVAASISSVDLENTFCLFYLIYPDEDPQRWTEARRFLHFWDGRWGHNVEQWKGPGMSVKQMPLCFLFSLLFWCQSSGEGCENFLQLCLWAKK